VKKTCILSVKLSLRLFPWKRSGGKNKGKFFQEIEEKTLKSGFSNLVL
jgi:hypothetical protein